MNEPRSVHLEAMRGIAALVVLMSHLVTAFRATDLRPGNPLFALVNGEAAVVFFFVLSGYVLSLKALIFSDIRLVARGALKRWPRLAGPVAITVLASWALWHAGLFWHGRAAAITGSRWLENFAGAFPPSISPDMSFLAALEQGLWGSFLQSKNYFDSVLWTMHWEFNGSIIVFVVSIALIVARYAAVQAIILAAVSLLMAFKSAYFLAFCLGLLLAWVQARRPLRMPLLLAAPMLLLALYLFGYRTNVGYYAWLPSTQVDFVYCASAVLLMISVGFCPVLQRSLSGHFCRALGRYSFPLYLVHCLMILSVGTISFVILFPILGFQLAAAISIGIILLSTAGLAHLLSVFETFWLRFVNQLTDAMVVRAPRLIHEFRICCRYGTEAFIPHFKLVRRSVNKLIKPAVDGAIRR
jgi:peptidoglycan/LPS O-acetylase OafA/YrhL